MGACLRARARPRGQLAEGGHGTGVALFNALARATPNGEPSPAMGVLPLGTGNGWAHALGAPKLHRCLELLSRTAGLLPARRSGLIEVEGTLAHFAGSGWDAMILDDYQRQVEASRGPGRHLSKSVYGYLFATLLRTVPKGVAFGNARVVIENLGDEVFAVDSDGRPRRLAGVGRGAVLYH